MTSLSMLSYDSTLARVRVSLAAVQAELGANATCTVQRSPNGINWTTVRGGDSIAATSSSAPLDDYEFNPDVANYYQVIAVPSATGIGTPYLIGDQADAAGSATCVITVANSTTGGDAIAVAAGTSGGDTITSVTDSKGNTYSVAESQTSSPSVYLYVAQDTAALSSGGTPDTITVTFSGTSAAHNAVAAGCAGVRASSAVDQIAAATGSTSTPTVTTSGLSQASEAVFAALSNGNSGGTPTWDSGWTSIGSVHDGSTAYTSLAYQVVASTDPVTASATLSTGVNWRLAAASLEAVTSAGDTYTDSITPSLGGSVWLKNLAFPFLNRAVTVASAGDITRPSRGGTFAVIGRTYPVAVTTTRGARQFDLTIATTSDTETTAVTAVFATGDIVYVQVPADYPVPVGGYYAAGDLTETRNGVSWSRRWITAPLTETAQPAPTVPGATITWTGVINAYATWNAVIAAEATWSDLLATLGAPGDVIVS
jgi:hypothetical protein